MHSSHAQYLEYPPSPSIPAFPSHSAPASPDSCSPSHLSGGTAPRRLQVIKGWDEGVSRMSVGEKATFSKVLSNVNSASKRIRALTFEKFREGQAHHLQRLCLWYGSCWDKLSRAHTRTHTHIHIYMHMCGCMCVCVCVYT